MNLNLPNILTLSRIGLAVVLVFLLEEGSLRSNVLAAIIFGFASLTDFYDGYLAKKRGLVSDFGKIMDPIADKVLLLSMFWVLADIGMIDWWMVIIIALRESIVTVSRLCAMRQGKVLAAERAGKIKTVVQIVAVSMILLFLVLRQCEHCSFWFAHVQGLWFNINYGLMATAVILTVYSGIDYFRQKSKI